MIPNRAFFYWSGDEMPWIRQAGLESFRFHNPDWDVEVFGDSDPVDAIMRSDIFRYHELWDSGGWYFDTDIIFTRPMSEFVTGDCDTGICYERTGVVTLFDEHNVQHVASNIPDWFSVASLFSSGNNDFFLEAHRYAETHPECFDKTLQDSYGTAVLFKRFGTLEDAEAEFPKHKFMNIPRKAFMPVDWSDTRELYRVNDDLLSSLVSDKDVYGVHWYGGERFSDRISSGWNDGTYWSDCVLGRLIGAVL